MVKLEVKRQRPAGKLPDVASTERAALTPREIRMNTVKPLTLAAALLLSAAAAQAQDAAGTINTLRGDVKIERDGQVIQAKADTKILPKDRIVTSPGASLGVTLSDNSRMAVGAKSAVALEEYAYNADSKEGKMALRVLRGTMGMITGLINKKEGNLVEVRTKTATAGIRGTEFIVEVPQDAEVN